MYCCKIWYIILLESFNITIYKSLLSNLEADWLEGPRSRGLTLIFYMGTGSIIFKFTLTDRTLYMQWS